MAELRKAYKVFDENKFEKNLARRRLFSPEEAVEILELAIEGKRPNGYYSDAECDLWLAFRVALKK